ncbi:alpha/beta-hydrolase [Peniophora sp. CONT]|nr:alpha/beta-hydrolase [Peniophora sp. CONT]
MVSLRSTLLWGTAFCAAQSFVLAQNTTLKVVDLGNVTYQSDVNLDIGVTSFLGIRYAAPPIGDLRFRAPQPANETGVFNVTTQPDECWQGNPGSNATTPYRLSKRDVASQNEDCLFLNVHVPTGLDLTSGAKLPVIVWIHGGGYVVQSVSMFNPVETFVRNSNYSVISVQMQYRLGPFGFISSEAVSVDGDLNIGLLDQQLALQWVQENIAAFGGDPSQVTIYGESAGAGSVLQHLVAHGGDTQPPLFRAAMMDSPFLPFQYAYNDPINEAIFANLSAQVNCPVSNSSLNCLRSVDAATLAQFANDVELADFFGVYTYVPVVDGSYIVERPTLTLGKNKTNADTLLVFTNAHEGDIFVDLVGLAETNTTLTSYIANLFPRMNDTSITRAANIYSTLQGMNASTVPTQAAYVMGEAIFVCPAYYTLGAFEDQAWKAEFAVPPALHGDELFYVFADNASSIGWPPFNNSDFITAIQQSLFSTAISLDPNAHVEPTIAPEWPSWTDAGQVLLFNETESGQPEVKVVGPDAALLERCAFWRSLSDVNAQ